MNYEASEDNRNFHCSARINAAFNGNNGIMEDSTDFRLLRRLKRWPPLFLAYSLTPRLRRSRPFSHEEINRSDLKRRGERELVHRGRWSDWVIFQILITISLIKIQKGFLGAFSQCSFFISFRKVAWILLWWTDCQQKYSYTVPCSGWQRMANRKWKETKQLPSMLPGPAVPGCCLVSLYFL